MSYQTILILRGTISWLVFTLHDPPLARDVHMFVEIFSFQCHVTVLVRTENILERARCQGNLLQKMRAVEIGIKILDIYDQGFSFYHFVREFSSPDNGKRQNVPICCFIREDVLE